MFECDELVSALKGEYNGTYEEFEKAIIEYVEKCMYFTYARYCNQEEIKNLIHIYYPCCEIKEVLYGKGEAEGINIINLKRNVVKNLMRGIKIDLLTIFHELSHIEYNIQIARGYATLNIIRHIKDQLLNRYQREQNRQWGYDGSYSYYILNYTNESSEIDAELNAIILTIKFMKANNIDYSDILDKLEKDFNELEKRKEDRNRYVGENIIFNSRYLSQDEAFDFAIKYNPYWVEDFPQLEVEYELVDGVVIKKKNITYQEYDSNNSLYYRCKQYIKRGKC